MPGENYNEYSETNTESLQSEIDKAVDFVNSDLNDLKGEVLGGKKVDFKVPDSINHFYRIEGNKIVFQLDQVKSYLEEVYKRLNGMKNQKFAEVSKEKNFTGTILAIQIVLKALESDPLNPVKYNIGKLNGKYDDNMINAIKIFQESQGGGVDGKPGKNTIGQLIKSLENFIYNRKEYVRVKNIVKDSLMMDATGVMWLGMRNNEETVKSITDYIVKGKLGTNEDPELEEKLNKIANYPLNLQLKNLLKEKKENGKLNVLNQDERFNNKKYDNLIVQYSKSYSVDPALIKILMYKESRFDPKARSGAGAKGLMQLMPSTAKSLGVKNVYDPKQNIEGGVKLISQFIEKYNGNISLALAAYNAGPGNVKKYGNKIPPFKQTKNYVKFIMNIYNSLK